MKEKRFTKKDGTEGINYTIEAGDQFIFGEYKEYDGKFGKNGFCVTPDEKWIKLTPAQRDFFKKFQVNKGTELESDEYTNSYGTFAGIRFRNQEDMNASPAPSEQPSSSPKPAGLPSLPKPSTSAVIELTNDEGVCVNKLLTDSKYAPWKAYAKVSAEQFGESMKGIADEVGMSITLEGDRLTKAHELFVSKL